MSNKEIKAIVDKINTDLDKTVFQARYILLKDVEILILEDFESNYEEVTILKENKAYLFGDDGETTMSIEQFITNLKSNWE